MTTYSKKLKDPRWQKRRLQILQRDDWLCQWCGDGNNTLHVHHAYYEFDRDPWDYPSSTLHTVCEECHATADELRLLIPKAVAGLCMVAQFGLFRLVNDLRTLRDNGETIVLLDEISDLVREHSKQQNQYGYVAKLEIKST